MKKIFRPDEVRSTPKFRNYYNSLPKDSELFNRIKKCVDSLKKNRIVGDKVEKNKWPKFYKDQYEINNLFRVETGECRLTYTLIGENGKIIACVLEFFADHVSYNDRFGY